MDDFITRLAHNLMDRVSGPMAFRMLFQPLMASFFAVRSGLLDARLGKPPYLFALISNREDRGDLLKDAWKSIGRIFVLAAVLDVVYQAIVQHFVYPGEVVITAMILAIVPYVVVRGLVGRFWKNN